MRLGNYSILEEIGRGARGIVYRAEMGGKTYAVKTLLSKPSDQTLDNYVRFQKEAAALIRVCHPSIVRAFDIGEHDGVPFLVTEYLEGPTLDRLVGQGPLDSPSIIKIALGLAGALTALHRFHLIHRDIKPANIIVTPDGEPHFIDLGMVGETSCGVPSETRAVVGTLTYAAPEQSGILKRPVDSRADLYALGITLYESSAGKPPFQSDDVTRLLQQHASQVPTSLRELRPDLSATLARIIGKLIEKDPDERYQSARGLLADLSQIEELDRTMASGAQVRLGANDQSGSSAEIPMFGRASELDRARLAWRAARDGRGGTVLIEGEGGSGKSRLASELVGEARADGAAILRGKCNSQGSASLASLTEAILSYFHHLALSPEKVRDEALISIRAKAGKCLDSLAVLSPVLRKLIWSGTAAPQPVEVRRQGQDIFFQNIIEVLRSIASLENGLVLCIDDVQWLDESSAEFLRRASASIVSDRILVLITGRNERGSSEALKELKSTIAADRLEAISLKPLTLEDSEKIILAMLGNRPIEPRAVTKVVTMSNLNPFALTEYLNSMLANGILRFQDGIWTMDENKISEVSLSTDLYQIILDRVAALDELSKRILCVAAVAGNQFSIRSIKEAVATTEDRVLCAVQAALASKLIEATGPDRYVFSHDRIREAFLFRIPDEIQREIHDRLAYCLELIPERSKEATYALAQHHMRGNIDQNKAAACRAAFEAGTLALADYANREAREFLRFSFELAGKMNLAIPETFRIAEHYGIACVNIGHLSDAHQAFDFCLLNAQTKLDLARVQYWKMRTLTAEGQLTASWEMFLKALNTLNHPYPKSTAWKIVSLLGLLVGIVVQSRLGLGYGKLNKRSEKQREEVRLMCLLFDTAYLTAFFLGATLDYAQITLRAQYFAYFLGTSQELANAQAATALLAGTLRLRSLVEILISGAMRIAQELHDLGISVHVRQYQAIAHAFAGETDRFESELKELVPLVQTYLPAWNRLHLLMTAVVILYQRGSVREAVELGQAALPTFEEARDSGFKIILKKNLAVNLTLLGSPREGLCHAEEAQKLAADNPGNVMGNGVMNMLTIYSLIDQGIHFGAEVEEAIDKFRASKLITYPFRSGFADIGLMRLQQYEATTDPDLRKHYRKLLKKAIFEYRFHALTQVHKCILLVLNGALARIDGNLSRALTCYDRAETYATECGSVYGRFWICRERARMERQRGHLARARLEAEEALGLAVRNGWQLRSRNLAIEFGLDEYGLEKTSSVRTSASSTENVDLTARRAVDALLEISVAASNKINPREQAASQLDAVIKFMGAERASILLTDPQCGELKLFVGRDASGHDIENLEGFSSTLVRKVFKERKPQIVTGTEEGEALGSQSIVAYQLKSVMAVPLLLKEDLKGVLYLDSSLAKGLFTESDLQLFSALATQIAAGVEVARLASIEAERRELQKDLALTAAVQELFLPAGKSFRSGSLSLSGFYQAASQASGDWWWHHSFVENTILVLVGDVTGHGPGPAMVTAATAACLQALTRGKSRVDMGQLIRAINTEFTDFARGSFQMTLSAMEIDGNEGTLRCWSAGACPFLVLPKSGAPKAVLAKPPSSPLGSPDMVIGTAEMKLDLGDRVLLCTDGIFELKLPDGSMLRTKKLMELLKQTRELDQERAFDQLVATLEQARGNTPLADDMTFVLVDREEPVTAVGPSPAVAA